MLSGYIIKNVVDGTPYEYFDVPCGRRQFYELRRVFFSNLYKLRNLNKVQHD
jgi:hypothetical protein